MAAGIHLMASKFEYGRLMVQVGVGSYMFLYLGIFMAENMQIEGFWYYLFLGTFQSAVIHYFVAKIFGPLFFGRGWCGYACWTSMVLDMLPTGDPGVVGMDGWVWLNMSSFSLHQSLHGL